MELTRLNYDAAIGELRRMEDDKRNARLDKIAYSSMVATWLAVAVAVVALFIALVPFKK